MMLKLTTQALLYGRIPCLSTSMGSFVHQAGFPRARQALLACQIKNPVVFTSERSYATVLDTAELLKKSSESGANGYNGRPTKRFWEKANIKKIEDGHHQINLDVRPIKTSSGHPLVVPASKKALAHLIVQEWATLPSLAIKPHSLPLTSLVARAIDIGKDQNSDQVRSKIIDSLMPYFDTDTMLIFAPSNEYSGALRRDQEKLYRPIIKWSENVLSCKLVFSDGDKGLTGNKQTDEAIQKAREWALKLDNWQLTAFERAVIGGKSFLGGMKLIQREINTAELAEAVTLEVTHQMRKWGEVEDSHDVDWADLRRQLSSAAVLLISD
ncbi:hypothetical protein V1511DRAFT_500110 [Dipodascopsis uninucleata]